jgi:hypothetical protein
VIHSGNTNKPKAFNLHVNFSITKKNVFPGHEITESSIYILQELNCMELLGETRHGILKYSSAIFCGNKEIRAVTTADCHSMWVPKCREGLVYLFWLC